MALPNVQSWKFEARSNLEELHTSIFLVRSSLPALAQAIIAWQADLFDIHTHTHTHVHTTFSLQPLAFGKAMPIAQPN
jgi:hypothetical protein